MSSYSVAVEVYTRTNLMLALVVLATIINGFPNINFLILMIFLSSVVPLPTKSAINALEAFVPQIFVAIRFWIKASIRLLMLLLHPFIVVLNFLFFTLMEGGLYAVVNTLRNASRFLSSTILGCGSALFLFQFQMMFFVFRTVSSIREWIPIVMTAVRYTQRISLIIWTTLHQSAIFHWVEEKLIKTMRDVIKLVFTLSFAFLVFPGPVSLGNYAITGHFHPGSILRFKSWLTHEPDPLHGSHSPFLDNCFSSWTALRTAHFFILTKVLAYTSWEPTTHAIKIKQRLDSWVTVTIATFAGLVLVFMSNNYFVIQVLHVVVAVGSLALFVVVLDGYHAPHYLLTLYGWGTLMVIVQDALVVAYEVFATINARTSLNVPLVIMGALTLWTCWRISIDVCGRIRRKIVNPSKSVL